MSKVRPFRVEISDAEIDDLRDRLARARWPEKEPVDDWSMGIPLAYVQERQLQFEHPPLLRTPALRW